MYSCKQVSQIVSESLDRKLPFWTRVQLQMHLAMCKLCSQFRKTMIRVDEEVKQHADDFENHGEGGESNGKSRLSPQARAKIKQIIDSGIQ